VILMPMADGAKDNLDDGTESRASDSGEVLVEGMGSEEDVNNSPNSLAPEEVAVEQMPTTAFEESTAACIMTTRRSDRRSTFIKRRAMHNWAHNLLLHTFYG
jgi:hypothetical protein